jgi:hypothetical protein
MVDWQSWEVIASKQLNRDFVYIIEIKSNSLRCDISDGTSPTSRGIAY